MRTLAALMLLGPFAAAQTTWYVDVNGAPPGTGTPGDPYTSIQYAIDQPTTLNNDVLQVSAGTYVENVVVTGKSLHLIGSGAESCVIQAAGPGNVVAFIWNGTLQGFTVTGGLENGSDAGVFTESGATVDMFNCVIAGNAGLGVRWRADGSMSSDMRQCTITANGLKGFKMEYSAVINMSDTIIWGNGEPPLFTFKGGHFWSNLSHDDVEDNVLFGIGPGMISEDPLFRDASNGDYHLLPGSPCIDTGAPASPLDPDGTAADRGAFPLDAALLVGENYCTAGTSASGCQAIIQAYGTPSATAPSGFTLSVTYMEGAKDGLFFYGTNGRQANPWYNGTSFVCVVPPRLRGGRLTAVGSTLGACDGFLVQDLNARWCPTCPAPAHNPGAGAVMQAQLWYRDPLNTSFGTSSMSDAVEFTVGP